MQTLLTKEEIQKELNRLAPFHHKIDLPYKLSTYMPEVLSKKITFTRVDNLVKHGFPSLLEACGGSLEGLRILDAACNCGGFVMEAVKYGSKSVLGIDIANHYIEQANFIKQAKGLENVEFKLMDIEDVEESSLGLFDITFCFGILYHLENPIHAMRQLSSVTRKIILVDTDIYINENPQNDDKEPLWMMNFPSIVNPDSRISTTTLWRSKRKFVQFTPNETAVIELLRFLGFSIVKKINPVLEGLEDRYYNGNRATFIGIR